MKPRAVVVFDFDGTLISNDYVSLYNVVDQAVVGFDAEEYKDKVNKLRNKYFAIVKRRKLTVKEQTEWFNRTIELYFEFGLTKQEAKDILRTVKLRDGVKECLEMLKEENIPVAVISYGIKDFIEFVLEVNGVSHLVDKIYSAKLRTFKYDVGIITGFYKETLILPRDKKRAAHEFAKKHKVPYKKIIGVGDSIHDDGLGDTKNNRFGIANDEDKVKLLQRCMGTVSREETFSDVQKWLEKKLDINQGRPEEDKYLEACANPLCGRNNKVCHDCGNFILRQFRISD
ncbi:HAD-IB family phosphatase [Candidatus Wolfebacteria bacterium]|nr:HAD-IB family phosphatase [Candidatus Wolfebacteria bacterium]